MAVTNSMAKNNITRYRFDRVGNVVMDRRQPGPMVGTDVYRTGDALFLYAVSSPARLRFKAARRERRAAARRAVA